MGGKLDEKYTGPYKLISYRYLIPVLFDLTLLKLQISFVNHLCMGCMKPVHG